MTQSSTVTAIPRAVRRFLGIAPERPPDWLAVWGYVTLRVLLVFAFVGMVAVRLGLELPVMTAGFAVSVAAFSLVMWHPSQRSVREQAASSDINAYVAITGFIVAAAILIAPLLRSAI